MSLLAYGQGMLAGDIGVGVGLTDPWASRGPHFFWSGDGLMTGERDSTYANINSEGGLDISLAGHHFLSLLAEAVPYDEISETDTPRPIRRELHWDSPPQSPGAVFVNLPYSVLQIVATSAKADLVVVGILQNNQGRNMETLLCVPRTLSCADLVEFKTDFFARVNGTVVAVDGRSLPWEFSEILGREPEALIGHHFKLEAFDGIFFGLWLNKLKIPHSAESIFSEAVQSLPMLLSTRIEARKYEQLGKRFDAILKMMPQAVVFVDDEVGQVLINPASADLLDLPTHGEVEPSRVASAMKRLAACSGTRTDPQKWYRAMSGVEEPQEIEEEWVLKQPRCVLHVRSFPVSSISAHGRLWLYENVTTDRDAYEAFQAANRAKSQFLAMMSHELRTPMTGVLGMLDLLHLTEMVPQQRELVKIMQESAEGLMQVINNILDFCKMEAGRLSLEEIDFSLSDVFEQVVTMHEKKLAEKSLKLDMKPMAGATVAVRGDPVRLRQIIANLVSNAIEFTEKGSITLCWRYVPCPPPHIVKPLQGNGRMKRSASGSLRYCCSEIGTSAAERGPGIGERLVELSGDRKDKNMYLEVKVVDTGVGIGKERLETLFAAADAGALKRDASGTGLGLAICKGLLQLMGGRMLPVESELCQGTAVTFVLPVLPAEDSCKHFLELSADKPYSGKLPLPPPGASTKDEAKTISVLVAEDNKVNQLLIRKIFRHYGHGVEVVSNGKLAVEAVQSKFYDLVLMDLQMPVLDGLSATRAIRALPTATARVPIYALSADALAPESGPMEETGLDGYLSKPIVWEDLSEVVDKVLASKLSSNLIRNM